MRRLATLLFAFASLMLSIKKTVGSILENDDQELLHALRQIKAKEQHQRI
jgi:hypothetical protein